MFRFPVAVALLALPAAALAQPSGADLELAKKHFELGRTYYDQASYRRALDAFSESYRLSQKPALLFNVGKCYEALGQLQPAIEHYERYLRDTGLADSNLSARVENLKKRLEASRARPTPAPTPPPPGRPVNTPTPAPTPDPASTPSADPSDLSTATGTDRPSNWMKWTGWGLVGVGGASIVTSVITGVLAKRKSDAVERYHADANRDWSQVDGELGSSGRSLEAAQIVTLIVGIAAASGGTALLLLAPKQRQTARIAPLLGPDVAGLSTRFSF